MDEHAYADLHNPGFGSDWRELDEPAEVGVAAVSFVCATCGFIRLHSREL